MLSFGVERAERRVVRKVDSGADGVVVDGVEGVVVVVGGVGLGLGR